MEASVASSRAVSSRRRPCQVVARCSRRSRRSARAASSRRTADRPRRRRFEESRPRDCLSTYLGRREIGSRPALEHSALTATAITSDAVFRIELLDAGRGCGGTRGLLTNQPASSRRVRSASTLHATLTSRGPAVPVRAWLRGDAQGGRRRGPTTPQRLAASSLYRASHTVDAGAFAASTRADRLQDVGAGTTPTSPTPQRQPAGQRRGAGCSC